MARLMDVEDFARLRKAGVEKVEAQAASAHGTSWAQMAAKQDLVQLESRLIHWMAGILVVVLASLLTLRFVLLRALNFTF